MSRLGGLSTLLYSYGGVAHHALLRDLDEQTLAGIERFAARLRVALRYVCWGVENYCLLAGECQSASRRARARGDYNPRFYPRSAASPDCIHVDRYERVRAHLFAAEPEIAAVLRFVGIPIPAARDEQRAENE